MAEVTRVISLQVTIVYDDKQAWLWSPEATEASARKQFHGADQVLVKVQDFVKGDEPITYSDKLGEKERR